MSTPDPRYLILVHGGAGLLDPARMSPARETSLRAGLHAALHAAAEALHAGESSLEAAIRAVVVLEEHPEFNAGRGAVLNRDGGVQLDAAVMEGATRRAGAVAAVSGVRSPVRLAQRVMQCTPHVLLAGEGARQLAIAEGLPLADDAHFITDLRRTQQQQQQQRGGGPSLDHAAEAEEVKGTVGAVVRDRAGRLAAATSTGGMTNKWPGRVGDSALIGAGTWAWDRTCAVSATGHGERFIQANAAGRLSALVELAGLSLADAAARLVLHELVEDDAEGGLIAVDAAGGWAMPFSSGGMLRGMLREGEAAQVGIWETMTAAD